VGSYLCAYVDQSPLPRVEPGDLATARIRVRNIGTATWRRDGPHPVLLGTGTASDLRAEAAWVSASRPARLREASVAPGQVGTFETVLRAPPTPGLHRLDVRPIAENLTWFNDAALYLALEVLVPTREPGHGLAAELILAPPPLLLRPGGRAEAPLRLRNSGRVRWTERVGESGPLVQLGTDEPRDHPGRFYTPEVWIGPTRPARVPSFVLPGQSVDLTVVVTAPTEPGQHAERYRLVGEGISWFDGPPIELRVLVV
jgi:hypothetical protein